MPQWFAASAVARPDYYDRDALPIFASSSTNRGPGGPTVVATYSPPFGYAAFIETLAISAIRTVAAGALGLVQLYAEVVPSYGGSYPVALLPMFNNTVGYVDKLNFSSLGLMQYQDRINLYHYDIGAGGSHLVTMSIKGTEFLYRS